MHSQPMLPAGRWRVDPARSTLQVAIKHLMVATVRGSLKGIDGSIESDAAGCLTGEVCANTASLDSGDDKRDGFLVSPAFLNALEHPRATVVVDGVPASIGDRWSLAGALTLGSVTRPATFQISVTVHAGERVTLDTEAAIDRHAFGLRFPQGAGAGDKAVARVARLTGAIALRPA